MEVDRFEALTVGVIEAFERLENCRERWAAGEIDRETYHDANQNLIQRAARLAQAWIVAGIAEGRIVPISEISVYP